jgi:hypothetical protein
VVLAAACLGAARSPEGEARRLEETLAALHPDWNEYIGAVRPAGGAAANIYLGLVEPGGTDPRRLADAPMPGRARRFDLLFFPAAAPADGPWGRLLLDHEYFHARHLARAADLPLPAFGEAAVDRHFREAMAWGYNLRRALDGVYGELPSGRLAEVESRYREHRSALQRFVRERDPEAWAYYARLLPAPDGTGPAETAQVRSPSR